MKFIQILFYFSAFFFHGYSQHSFELLISNTHDEYPFEILQWGSEDYFITTISREDYTSKYFSKIIRISCTGEITGEREVENPDGDCILYNLLQTGENSMVAIGEWKYVGTNSDIWYVGLDTSLNIQWSKKYDLSADWIIFIRSFINSEGKIISGASIAQFPLPSTSKVVFMETSLEGDSLFGCYNLTGNSPMFNDILEFDTGYLAISYGFSSYPGSEILTLDRSFNILAIDSIPHRFERALTAKKKNDSSYYLTGNYYFNSQSDIGIELLNQEHQQIYFTYTGDPQLRDYGGADQSMDYFFPDTIFTAGTNNIDPYNPYYSTFHSFYCLNNFDSTLNLRWTKFYGGDAYYVLRYILATSDGGALLSGTKYDDSNPDNKLDIYIVKVDSCGLITGINGDQISSGDHAVIYPNPGSDYFNIRSGIQISGAWFTLYNLYGKQILKLQLTDRHYRIDTQRLVPGAYVWTIQYKEREVGNGKWVLVR
ncbi:MAG: T9SS type A sorting domain-containing protein [Bacteroidales bacterium]|nr:T9SS type A sorting domain-containing protein [Bacteroidales bacterium]